MTAKPDAKRDDAEQSKRFIEDAKRLGASEKKEDADRAFKRVVSRQPNKNSSDPSA
jgi:hypothetical protein